MKGQLRRARKPTSVRGVKNHNHGLKNRFKSTASQYAAPFKISTPPGRSRDEVGPGRLILVRKMAAMTLDR